MKRAGASVPWEWAGAEIPQQQMKVQRIGKVALAGIAVILVPARAAEDSTAKTTFVDHVVPVLESSCLNCHNADETKGGLDLSSYAAAMAGGSGGQIVQPGSPDRSRLYTLSAHLEEPHMPPNKPKIDQAHLDVFKRWIEDGLLETKGSKAKKSTGPTLAATVEVTGDRPKEPAMPKHLLLEPEVVPERGSAVTALASSPWAPVVAIGGQKQVLLYRTEPLELVGILPFPEGFPEALSFSRNGALLLAGGGRGGKSGKAVAWDVKSGQRVIEVGREFDTALAADISPDHRLVALGGPGRNIKIYDAQTGDQLHSIKKHPDWLLEVEFSPDGVLFASGGRNGEIFVWEADTGIEFYELSEHQKAVTGLTWRADSNVLAACSEDGNVSVWEMQNGKQMKKWAAHPGGALAIQFAPDGSLLATAGRDKTVKIWDLNGALKREIKGFPDIVTAVTFTHDGKKVISGDWQGGLKVWDAGSGVEVGRLVSNPPTVEEQLARAEARVREVEAKWAGLSTAGPASEAAMSEAKKKRDAAERALAQVKKEQVDAAEMVKRGEQVLAEAAGNARAAGQARQAAQKMLEETRSAAEKARAQMAAVKAGLADLDGKIAAAPQELAALDKQILEADARTREAVQARDVAKRALDAIQVEANALPGDAAKQARLVAARKGLDHAESAKLQIEALLQDLREKRAGKAAAVASLARAKQEKSMELKTVELLISQQPESMARAEKQMAEADAKLMEAQKVEVASKARVEEAKKLVVSSGESLKQREAEFKAASAAAEQAQSRESAAKEAAAQINRELAFARYEVDKWQAARVNLQLHAESGVLTNYREQYIQLEGKAKSAVAEHQAAAQSVASAEQTLKKARAQVQQNTAAVETAKDQVVETGLKVLTAALVDQMRAGGESAPQGESSAKLEGSELQSIAAKAPEFKKELENTASRVKQTVADLAQASRTVQETPAMIQERERQRAAKEGEMKRLLQEVKEQEKKLEEKSKEVDVLRKRYEELYREWSLEKVPAGK